MSVDVTNNTELSRYEARVDGELAGFSTYTLRGSDIVFTHTEVHLEGKGVGGTLVREALDDVRRNGTLKVVPLCPFVKAYIEKHPEYADLT
jgi:predicted GNAT family acetyltransferase